MKRVYHPNATRRFRYMGWVKLYQSFNLNYPPTPNRRNFGVMVILDNGIIAPGGKGFGMHPHQNMEIVSVVLSGAMVHSDTAGHNGVNVENAVQLISAGTGVEHSEYNHSEDTPIDNLQIWFLPEKNNLPPRYQNMVSPDEARRDKLQLLVSPNAENDSLHINQKVWMWRGSFQKEKILTYKTQQETNGIYLFVIEGKSKVAGQELSRRDGLAIWAENKIEIKCTEDVDLLIIDVPLQVQDNRFF